MSRDSVLHKLWTKAVGTPGYDKEEWNEGLNRMRKGGVNGPPPVDAEPPPPPPPQKKRTLNDCVSMSQAIENVRRFGNIGIKGPPKSQRPDPPKGRPQEKTKMETELKKTEQAAKQLMEIINKSMESTSERLQTEHVKDMFRMEELQKGLSSTLVEGGAPEAARIFWEALQYEVKFLLAGDKWQGEICKRCGRRNNVGFRVSDDIWDKVVGNSGSVWCLQCFDQEAQRKGIKYKVHNTFVVTWADWEGVKCSDTITARCQVERI